MSGHRPESKQEGPLTAVILCDGPFDARLLALASPWAALPLVNEPLLSYTLEFVAAAGCERVLLMSRSGTLGLENVLRRWRGVFAELTPVECADCLSCGDVMRLLDARRLISDDFVLVPAGALCTNDLRQAVAEHKKRRKKDKNAVMTLVYARAPGKPPHPLVADAPLLPALGLNTATQRLLYFKELPTGVDLSALQMPKTMQGDTAALWHGDIADCQIAVCSLNVPALFSDAFDFQTRSQLVRDILVNEEISGQTVYVHMLPESDYAACVQDFNSYMLVTKHVLERWSYPLVPDMLTSCVLDAHNGGLAVLPQLIYLASPRHTNNMPKVHEFVWRCDNFMATVPANGRVDPCTFLSAQPPPAALKSLGFSSVPAPFTNDGTCLWSLHGRLDGLWSLGNSAPPCMLAGVPDGDGAAGRERRATASTASTPAGGPGGESREESAEEIFAGELLETLKRGLDEGLPAKDIILEINGAKFAYNISAGDLTCALIRSILTLSRRRSRKEKQALAVCLKHVCEGTLAPVLGNYVKTDAAQMNALAAMEEVALEHTDVAAALPRWLHCLYSLDLLSEESILRWHEQLDVDDEAKLEQHVGPFVKWLREAEEEDGDSDSGEESE